MAEDNKNHGTLGAHLQAVRETLQRLAIEPGGENSFETLEFRKFRDPLSDKRETVELLCDSDRAESMDVQGCIMKLMEHVQIFLVADRLGSELKIGPKLMPAGYDLTPFIERILKAIGRGLKADRELKTLRYYPYPHLRATTSSAEYVDFAGFVIVMLTDFIRWAPDTSHPAVVAAEAELHTAMEFLTDPETIIADEDQGTVGWGFVAASQIEHSASDPLPDHRHIFPTARAIVAIYRYSQWKGRQAQLADSGQKLLPKALRWIDTLAQRSTGKLLYYPTDNNEAPYFADHIFATEALLTLVEAGVDGAKNLAFDALERFLEAYDDRRARSELDKVITHRIAVKGHRGDVFYDNRATLATCLATLAQGVEMLVGEERGKSRDLARKQCNGMVKILLSPDRRNHDGLWPKDFTQFHWVLGAVEALLRYDRYAQEVKLSTSVEKLEMAADLLLKDERFLDVFRKLLVEKVKEMGSPDIQSMD